MRVPRFIWPCRNLRHLIVFSCHLTAKKIFKRSSLQKRHKLLGAFLVNSNLIEDSLFYEKLQKDKSLLKSLREENKTSISLKLFLLWISFLFNFKKSSSLNLNHRNSQSHLKREKKNEFKGTLCLVFIFRRKCMCVYERLLPEILMRLCGWMKAEKKA